MAKQFKADDLKSAEQVQDAMNTALLTNEPLDLPIDQAIEMFKKSPDVELEEITSDYFEFDKIGDYYFIFTGVTTMKGQDGNNFDAVKLVGENGETLVNANRVLVNELKKLTDIPSFVKVSYTGTEKSPQGIYKKFRIFKLRKKES